MKMQGIQQLPMWKYDIFLSWEHHSSIFYFIESRHPKYFFLSISILTVMCRCILPWHKIKCIIMTLCLNKGCTYTTFSFIDPIPGFWLSTNTDPDLLLALFFQINVELHILSSFIARGKQYLSICVFKYILKYLSNAFLLLKKILHHIIKNKILYNHYISNINVDF